MSMSQISMPAHAGTDRIPSLVAGLRAAFDSGKTRPIAWRLEQLEGLARLLHEQEEAIVAALAADVGKPQLESFMAEVAFTASEVRLMRKKLPSWLKPQRVATPLPIQPGRSFIMLEPLGVVLIIGPWNYPFQLVIGPLIGALAGGNCAILKPSEVAPRTSELLAAQLPRYLDSSCVQVVEGGVPETTALLAERFDHIFYTGNGTVGRIVMTAAAKHLTPVTLELGGKSPCIVDRDVDLEVAARRIAWGKFYNAGQTCVAPDYVLAHRDIYDGLLERLEATVRGYYGDDPQKSPDYARIVNARHVRRLAPLLASGKPVFGGRVDEADRYIAPTVLRDVRPEAPVMADEIFGPILPVLPIGSVDEAIGFINARPKPLALYLFSNNEDVQRKVLERTSSGAAVINHVWVHMGIPGLPFGGVGESGMGAYHGRASLETFTHKKGVVKKPFRIDPPLVYPPYSDTKQNLIRRLL